MKESTAPKLAPAQESPKIESIKKAVTRKLFKSQRPTKSTRDQLMPSFWTTLTTAFHGVFMIFPAIIIGIMCGIGAAFETGIKKALETYRGK